MINIVNVEIRNDDNQRITRIGAKLKSIDGLLGHPLLATIAAAFFKTTLLTDSGDTLQIIPNPDRKDIVDIFVTIKSQGLTYIDVANFLGAFQKALQETTIQF